MTEEMSNDRKESELMSMKGSVSMTPSLCHSRLSACSAQAGENGNLDFIDRFRVRHGMTLAHFVIPVKTGILTLLYEFLGVL